MCLIAIAIALQRALLPRMTQVAAAQRCMRAAPSHAVAWPIKWATGRCHVYDDRLSRSHCRSRRSVALDAEWSRVVRRAIETQSAAAALRLTTEGDQASQYRPTRTDLHTRRPCRKSTRSRAQINDLTDIYLSHGRPATVATWCMGDRQTAPCKAGLILRSARPLKHVVRQMTAY